MAPPEQTHTNAHIPEPDTSKPPSQPAIENASTLTLLSLPGRSAEAASSFDTSVTLMGMVVGSVSGQVPRWVGARGGGRLSLAG